MDIYLIFLIAGVALIACIVAVLWIILIRSQNRRKLNVGDAALSGEDLGEHAKKTAIEHSISKKTNFLNWPVPRMNESYNYILSVYRDLNEDIQKKYTVPPAAEWLLDNFYIIEEQVKGLRRDLTKADYFRLPVLKTGPMKGYARIFAIAVELVAHTDGQIDETILSDYLKAYQSHSILLDREIFAVPLVLRLALIENIRHLCENIKNTQTQWHKADEIFDSLQSNEGIDTSRVVKLFKDSLKTMDEANPPFIEHLFYRLRSSGRSYTEVLRTMDESLIKFVATTEQITQKEHNFQSVNTVSMSNCISSLRHFATLDWSDLFESASFVEQILKRDPDGTYPLMDLYTRNYYRSKVEELSSAYGVSELFIAREAIELAQKFRENRSSDDPADADNCCQGHVGYYLIGKGVKILEDRQEKVNQFKSKGAHIGIKSPGAVYIGSIGLITLLAAAIAVQYTVFSAASHLLLLSVLTFFAVLVPASEIAVNIVNWIVCKALKPAVFPRMELKDGIPERMATIVAVPTLLPDEKRVKALLSNLESHYLSNREENLYFALIGAFRDSDFASMEDDEKIVGAALRGIRELNEKYASGDRDKFYFFHRESQFSEENNKWFGWERKRGALMEFNELVLGSTETSFAYSSSDVPHFSNVKYIITLDSDTILPMGMAKKMIGTMAHPLNRPVIDIQRNIVIEGYGLMQPRIDVESESSNKSLFSQIFTGQEGLDPYANAISDVYQDLFGEGIYTGKGIYDLEVFQSVLRDAIPDNSILSHDLLEGSYVRTGLVTDLKLVDSYPSKYNSFSARLHRWVRGDWQLCTLLFGKIPDRSLSRIKNPLSLLSRWKMFDNLRRSIVSPSLMVLAALSFSILPGNIFFWLGLLVIAQVFPLIMASAEFIFSGRFGNKRTKRYMPVMFGLKTVFLQSLLNFVFLPYQSWLMLDAVLVTLTRVFITKKNLLEWITSEDVEKYQKNTQGSYISNMRASLLAAPLYLGLSLALKPETAAIGLVFFILWASAPFIAFWISKDQKAEELKLSGNDLEELRRIARKTWRYFEEFINTKGHYLVPDNYQSDPPRGAAYRTSPTNIGLGLLSTLSARDFGYIGTFELMTLIDKTVSTVEGLEKWNGHLFNWYDTRTLKPLRPSYISTVDSGNLACYLITLEQGMNGYLSSPLADVKFSNGIRDTLACAGKEGFAALKIFNGINGLSDKGPIDLILWNRTLNTLSSGHWIANMKGTIWKAKIEHMIRMLKNEMMEFMPWLDMLEGMPEDLRQLEPNEAIATGVKELSAMLYENTALQDLPALGAKAEALVGKLIMILRTSDAEHFHDGLAWLEGLEKALAGSIGRTKAFIDTYKALTGRISKLSAAMKFSPLYDKKKQLFSIGYNIEENKLSNSYYDLLASEARQTSYMCIARGEIPSSHWFKMGRNLTVVDHYKGLISWTGTMFEYLMPLLIMKSYKNTLLDETYSFVIKSQKKYGRQRNMPWGTSESGFHSLDKHHDYQYKAIGVPWLGLKRGLIEDAVAAPYATFLALLADPEGAVQNIKYLKREGLEGPYGFYEAADYTPERLPFETKCSIVKSFMAHHQGMSLLALDNCLNADIMQTRFHADPSINAARLLLQEKVSENIVITRGLKAKVAPFKEPVAKEISSMRTFSRPDPVLPKAHLLSNGNYSIMITDRGTGYSKSKMAAVTRWRADSTLDPYGMFFYLRNADTDAVWSAAYAPLNVMPDKYEVEFTADKATFRRMDGQIETKTEVIATSGDNAEIRRISLKNLGDDPCVIEVTSYFEIVLAPQAADEAHPAFSNLFVETGVQPDRKCIIANRRPRSETEKCLWIANAVVPEGEVFGDIQFETDRIQFIGRGHDTKDPIAMESGKSLSNTAGPVLDPVMSIRASVRVEPGKTARISYVTVVSESNELLNSLVEKYASPDAVEGAFRLALARSRVETNYLDLDVSEIELYQNMISDILFISPVRRANQEMILMNHKGQSSLWRYGISGDLPIILAVLKSTGQVEILTEILKAHEYWRLMDLKADLVILCDEEYSYTLPLHQLISDIVLSSQTHDILNRAEDVFILDRNKIPEEDIHLLYAVSRIILTGDGGAMADQVAIGQESALPKPAIFKGQAIAYDMPETNAPELLYYNGLGGFSPDGGEYVIRLGKGQNTPAPWLNVISNREFGFMVSESGSGYSWYGNSRENKITPWSNDVVSDSPGETIYIRDDDTGRVWTTTPLPIREEEPYTITHGFGYSLFEHTSHGIKQRLTQHVPVDEPVKISILSLKNISQQKRQLTLTYYIRPVLGVSDQVTAMHIKTSAGEGSSPLMLENPYNEEFAGMICFLDASSDKRTVTSDRKEFFGTGDARSPESLKREALSGTTGTGFDPCGAIQVKVTLAPNENRDITFLLGMAARRQTVGEITGKYRMIRNAKESLIEAKGFWKSRMDIVQADTPSTSMNLMLNGWLQYQIISCRLWARSGFYQAGGAYGFRDQLQDCLSIAHLWPEAAREQILLHARHQFIQGDVQHWWHEPHGKGTRTHFSDDRLWLPYVAAEYIRITGDKQILDEDIPFLVDTALNEFEDERYGTPAVSNVSSSLYDHCLRAVDISLGFGEYGLPLMGSGDWNDGMNTVGNRGRGESVWLGWFLATVLEMMSPICMEKGDSKRSRKYSDIRVRLSKALEKNAWDGNWYRRAYFDNGMPLGSAQNSECKIDSISQSWAVISGAGNPARAARAMKSLEDHLVVRADGLIKLLTPPFDQGELEPGYIKGYIPGVRENGGQYTHAAAWAIIAFAEIGEGDKAWELFELINPVNLTENYRECSRYRLEPYVMAADVYSIHPHAGRGGWSWYTGAAGWMYRAGLEYILGLRKNGDSIVMDPCIPCKWKEYAIKYNCLDTIYDIKVKNPDGISKGVRRISIDGKISAGNRINLEYDGKTHDVEVIMGS